MENVTEALYMASAMMLFLIALSVAMFSVGTLRKAVDATFSQTETMEMAKNSGKYINFIRSSDSTRIVDSATVVSSIMRSTKENFAIYIRLKNPENIDNSLIGTGRNQITLSTAYSDLEINGTKYINAGDKLIEFAVGDKRLGINQEGEEILRNGFYDHLKDKTSNKFYEYLGVYQKSGEASSENKVTYRIITYVEKEM